MPRPGPRPYECVRRAWHSDRHQPIRGSLIQELFRIVHEVHSSATRKNKEWQEKLPVVVLKAEEIMYSKANSEAEYVDFNTLWDRANEAINTIIKRDDTETGELLQPCIEAALHLGCTPRRVSRNQRNTSPTCYLNPEKPQIPPVPLSKLGNKIQGNCVSNCSFVPQSLELLAANLMSCSSKNLDTSVSSSCSVYPLYYGHHEFHLGDPNSETLILKRKKADKEEEDVMMEKHSSCGQGGSSVVSQLHNSQHISDQTPPGNGCDLSLRLGPLQLSCLDIEEKRWPRYEAEVQGGGGGAAAALGVACVVETKPSDYDYGGDNGESSRGENDRFSFFPKGNNAHGMLDYYYSPTKWVHETQNPDPELSSRKRKSGFSHQADDRQLCWPLKIPFKQLHGRTNNVDKGH